MKLITLTLVTILLISGCDKKQPKVTDSNETLVDMIVIDNWQPATITFDRLLVFTAADINGIAKVEWLDPNNTQIDEGARWFFEKYLKSMCDNYIEANCKERKTK